MNSVRWSPDGNYLASGSDDSYIIIYKYTIDKIMNQSFGSKPVQNKENWIRCYTLQGHTMDVLDIHWSPRGLLATASIDNTIMIWNPYMNHNKVGSYSSMVLNPIKCLHGHQSFVRGLCFDATGKYLASSGADNIIILWDGDNNFKEIRRIRNPLKDSPDRSLFRRMDWGPDGFSLCITAAMKSGKPIGNILKRKTWDIVADLVGHSAATSSCRFFPQLLNRDAFLAIHSNTDSKKPSTHEKPKFESANDTASTLTAESIDLGNNENSDGQRRKSLRLQGITIDSDSSSDSEMSDDTSGSSSSQNFDDVGFKLPSSALSCAVAIGDQAGVVSLWGSHSNRALLVLRDIVQGPVTDIAWLNCSSSSGVANLFYGKAIFACSGLDGSVVIVDLEDEVLGEVISKDHKAFDSHIEKLYGKKLDELVKSEVAAITTDPSIKPSLQISNNSRLNPQPPSTSSSTAVTQASSAMPSAFNRMMPYSSLSQTKDGKKRIRPVLVQEDGSLMPQTQDIDYEPIPTAPASQRVQMQGSRLTVTSKPQYLKIVINGNRRYSSVVTLARLFSEQNNSYQLSIDGTRLLQCTFDPLSLSTSLKSSTYEIIFPVELSCLRACASYDMIVAGGINGHVGLYSLSTGKNLLPNQCQTCIVGSTVAFIDIMDKLISVMTVDGSIRVWSIELNLMDVPSVISKYHMTIETLLMSLSPSKTIVEKFGFDIETGQVCVTIKITKTETGEQGNKVKILQYFFDNNLECWLTR